jgi:hypothetical protein
VLQRLQLDLLHRRIAGIRAGAGLHHRGGADGRGRPLPAPADGPADPHNRKVKCAFLIFSRDSDVAADVVDLALQLRDEVPVDLEVLLLHRLFGFVVDRFYPEPR